MLLTAPRRYVFTVLLRADKSEFYSLSFLFLCVSYLATAGVLALVVHYGVMDETFHLVYSKPYVDSGINLTTLYHHVPPTGVSSHLWFAGWMWLMPTITYTGLRLTTCLAILLLACVMYLSLSGIGTALQKKVLTASAFMFASPYFFLSVSAVMTEGPSLVFLFAGLLLLFISRFEHLGFFLLGCVLLGVATVARFYFIPLLPALLVVLLLTDYKKHGFDYQRVTCRRLLFYGCVCLGLIPLIGLILLWGGLTPPSFNQLSDLKSGVGFNATRPISVLAIIGAYITPVVLVNTGWNSRLWPPIGVALAVALVLVVCRVNVFHTTALGTTVFSGLIEHGLFWIREKSGSDLLFCLSLFAVYSFTLFSLFIVVRHAVDFIQLDRFADKGMVFSLAFVLFFVLVQAFVGGNHPFFERYLIHPWPFMGYVLVGLFPRWFNVRSFFILATYTGLAVAILVG